jgi:hypothetical protein
MSSENTNLKQMLTHVLWIGGGADAGKTTVAKAIVERHGLQSYNFDQHQRSQIERMAATGYYEGRKNPYEVTPDEIWVNYPPEEMAIRTIRTWSRRAEVAIEDLLAMPQQPLIIAEGPGFYPEVVQPLLSSYHQAIWFVPEPAFKQKIATLRGKPNAQHQTRDPQRARENALGRDLLMAQHVREEAIARGLRLVEVDGTRSIEETITLVEEHFAPFLQNDR